MVSSDKNAVQQKISKISLLMSKMSDMPNIDLEKYKNYERGLFEKFNKPHIETVVQTSRLKQQTGTATMDELNHKTFGQMTIPTAPYNEILTGLKRWNFRKKGYYLFGPVGMGKTMLMKAFRKDLYDRGLLENRKFQFFSGPSLFKNLKEFDKKVTRNGYEWSMSDFAMDRCVNSDILVIDDLGVKDPTSFEIDSLFSILDRRIESTRDKGTFITSNLDISTIGEAYGDRILDRIMGLMEPKRLKNDTGKSYRSY